MGGSSNSAKIVPSKSVERSLMGNSGSMSNHRLGCSQKQTDTLTPRKREPECGHLLAVANQQDVADQHRVVPGLAFDRRGPRDLFELVRGRRDHRQLAFLRQHQQHVLVGQQDELAVAVASAFPRALAVLEIDAREDAAVKAEGMTIVNDEVVEVGLQPDRAPALFDGPSAGSVCDRDAANVMSLAL